MKKEELLVLAEYAFGEAMCVPERKVEPQDLNQAYKEIVALIKKPEVSQGVKELKALNTVIKVINRMPEEKQQKFYRTIAKKVKKTQVTEEWIEQKAKKLREINIESEKGSLSLVFLTQSQAEDFIRSLVEEIHGRK